MLKDLRDQPRALLYAILVHVVLLIILLVSFDWDPSPQHSVSKQEIVEAVVVDEAQVRAKMDKLKREEIRKKRKEEDRLKKLKKEAAAAKKKRQEEERLARKKKKKAEVDKKKAEAKLKAEELRIAKLEKKRKAEEKRLAELSAKRKKEEDKKRKEEDKKRKEDARRRMQEEEDLRRKEELAAQIAEEEKAAQEAAYQTEIIKYTDLIKQKVSRAWIEPPGNQEGLSSKVGVRIIPGGEVVGVRIIKSSGNAIFDSSVERAVRKASPLPFPDDANLVNRMREINFIFTPKS